MEYGIQLYSLRDVAEHDLRAALAAVAKTGYKAVEFAGFFGHSAPEVRDWLAAYGLRVCGTHTPWQELTPDALPATIAYHKALGNSRIIVPGADLSTREGINAFVALANEAGPRLAAEGITLGYHNHTAEFLPNRDGLVPHDELAARTTLLFEIDTYWAWHAGRDPVALLERLAPRVPVIHLKDGLADGEGKPLGQGAAPLPAVLRAARAHGMEIVVESETLTPDGPTEAATCFTWLAQQG